MSMSPFVGLTCCELCVQLNENVCMEEVTVQTMKKPKKPKS